MSEESVVPEEVRQLLGVEFEPVVYQVEKGMIRQIAEAIEDPNPLWQDEEYARKTKNGGTIAPPTFLAALRHEGIIRKFVEVDSPLRRLLNGGNEIEYFQPIKPGDVIAVTGRLAALREREGRTGKMLFMVIEMDYRNQQGEIVARSKNTIIRY
jgi:acyl dehydratase